MPDYCLDLFPVGPVAVKQVLVNMCPGIQQNKMTDNTQCALGNLCI
jgi:hypothetical protein